MQVIPAGPATFVTVDAPHATPAPACATQNRWTLDATTMVGQSFIATVLTAFAGRKHITIVGTGFCDLSSDSETVGYLVVED